MTSALCALRAQARSAQRERRRDRDSRLRQRELTGKELHFILAHVADKVVDRSEFEWLTRTSSCERALYNCKCEVCAIGKSKRRPRRLGGRASYAKRPGETIHFDTAGPFGGSINGERYAVVGIDEATGFITVCINRSKGSKAAAIALEKACHTMSTHGYRVTQVHSDQGTEFAGEFKAKCEAYLIEQTFSETYSPWQNGRAERAWQTLNAIMHCMLWHARLELVDAIWGDAILHAADLANIVFKVRLDESPLEALRRHGGQKGRLVSIEALHVFGAKFILHGPALHAYWVPPNRQMPEGVIGFYVGRVARTPHVMRFIVPDLFGRMVYCETSQAVAVEDLLSGPRTCVPAELASWVGKAGPFPGGGTSHMMQMHNFGVQGEMLIDARCPGEQIILRQPGKPPVVYDDEADAKTMSGQVLESASDQRCDIYEPAMHMDVARYFGEKYRGIEEEGEAHKATVEEGWFYGRVTQVWTQRTGPDKGVKYFHITYDDGDTEDIEHVAMRRVVRAMHKAQLETQDLIDADEAAEGAATLADGADDSEADDAAVIPVHGAGPSLVSDSAHSMGGGTGGGIIPQPADTDAKCEEASGESKHGGASDRVTRTSALRQLMANPKRAWARGLAHVTRHSVSTDEILTRVGNGENFDELTGQLKDNHFDKLELEKGACKEDAVWRLHHDDGSSEEVDFVNAAPEVKAKWCAKAMRMEGRTAACNRLMQMPKGTIDARAETQVGALSEEFVRSGGVPEMQHKIEDLNITVTTKGSESSINKGGTKVRKKVTFADEEGEKSGVDIPGMSGQGAATESDDAHSEPAVYEVGRIAKMTRRWSQDYEWSESIEDEDTVAYVLRCTVKKTGKAVYIDEDNPPWRLALTPGYPNHAMWKECMIKELREQLSMEAWSVVRRTDIPKGSLILRSNWRLLLKRDARGRVLKCKGRAYIAGYNMVHGVHFAEVTSPTVRPATLRMLLGHAAKYNMVTAAYDISVAFLSAKMDFDVLFHVYPRCSTLIPDVITREGEIARAHAAIYGTRQGSRQFWKKLCETLRGLGYQVSRGDACLWYRAVGADGEIISDYDIKTQWDPDTARPVGSGTGERDGVRVTYVVHYVDDLAVSGTSEEAVKEMYEGLRKTFRIRDEGPLEDFLGCLIQRSETGSLHISQPEKCRKAAAAAGVSDEVRKEVKVPSKGALTKPDTPVGDMDEEERRVVDSMDYRAFVGIALHIYVFTRPDIGYAINQLASHCNDPRGVHVEAAKQLGRYLQDTAELGVLYDGGDEEEVKVYCDADFADCVDTRRSISGLVIMVYGGATSWTCRKQASVALSTMEAEAVSMRVGFCEVIGVKWDMEVFDPQLGDKTWPLFEDNQSLIAVVEKVDGGKYEARKHIAVRVMWLREVVATGMISVKYIGTEDQVADVMTKALPEKEFVKHRASMMNIGPIDERVS